MAVLVEGISVVMRADALLAAFEGDFEAFKHIVPNRTLCADGELVRVGFMTPADVQAFVETLAGYGLAYVRDGKARDLVVVDQLRGPMAPCDWIEFGHASSSNHPDQSVAGCRIVGSTVEDLVTPEGWEYETSLSASFAFVPDEHQDKSMTFLRHEDGFDVYRNEMTGQEMYVGRTSN